MSAISLAQSITFLVLLILCAFIGVFVYAAPAVVIVTGYVYFTATKESSSSGKKNESTTAETRSSTATYTRLPAPLYKLFAQLIALGVGTWFGAIALMVELILGAKLRYTVVASREVPGTDDNSSIKPTLPTTTEATSGGSFASSRAKALGLAEPVSLDAVLHPPHDASKYVLIIMNHRSRIDWLVLWLLLARVHGFYPVLRHILKDSLAPIPVIGWACQCSRFIFLSRSWARDETTMNRCIHHGLTAPGEKSVLIMFPEGTDLAPHCIAKSHEFAEKTGKPKYNYVLLPRTTGTVAMKNQIGPQNLEAIVDITIAYQDRQPGVRTNDAHMVSGRMARSIHFMVERFAFPESKHCPKAAPYTTVIPSDDASFTRWIEERFALKERDLSSFYSASPVGFVPVDVEKSDVEHQVERLPSAFAAAAAKPTDATTSSGSSSSKLQRVVIGGTDVFNSSTSLMQSPMTALAVALFPPASAGAAAARDGRALRYNYLVAPALFYVVVATFFTYFVSSYSFADEVVRLATLSLLDSSRPVIVMLLRSLCVFVPVVCSVIMVVSFKKHDKRIFDDVWVYDQ